jgi:hypothetical protein
MGMTRAPRSAFTPEVLSTFEQTMDEVWKELRADGAPSFSNLDVGRMRTKVAQKLIAFASSGWSAVQIKQLLLRALRNESRRVGDFTLDRSAGTNTTRSDSRQDAAERT